MYNQDTNDLPISPVSVIRFISASTELAAFIFLKRYSSESSVVQNLVCLLGSQIRAMPQIHSNPDCVFWVILRKKRQIKKIPKFQTKTPGSYSSLLSRALFHEGA